MITASPCAVTPTSRTGAPEAARITPRVAAMATIASSRAAPRGIPRRAPGRTARRSLPSLFAIIVSALSQSSATPFGLPNRFRHLPLLDERQRIVHVLREDDGFLAD